MKSEYTLDFMGKAMADQFQNNTPHIETCESASGSALGDMLELGLQKALDEVIQTMRSGGAYPGSQEGASKAPRAAALDKEHVLNKALRQVFN